MACAAISWVGCAWADANQTYQRLDAKLSCFDSDESEFKPALHQKRTQFKRKAMLKPRKGIGFCRQFKGYRYPVGNKTL